MHDNRVFIVSGSNGFIGSKVVASLSNKHYKVIALCRDKTLLSAKNNYIEYTENSEFLNCVDKYTGSDFVFIHLAFARANKGYREIASGLNFTKDILNTMPLDKSSSKFIYISSQGIYGNEETIRSTKDLAQPNTPYSMAKYAGELLVESLCAGKIDYCILRLDNVIQSQNLIKALSKSAITKNKIHIIGGKQVFSYIDGDDAADAIVKCATFREIFPKHIYNVGPNRMRVSLLNIAKIIEDIASQDNINVTIDFEPDETTLWAGMDTDDFNNDFKWTTNYGIDDMIKRVFESVREELVQ